MIIKQEQNKDFHSIYELIKTAFESAEHADGNEQDLAEALRKGDSYIPELSLVAEVDGKIVGHIMFTKLKIGDQTQLALAPLSVLPEYQRQGIGTALIKEGHKRARQLGYAYSVVLGSEKYYPKAGYLPAKNYGILPPFEAPDKNFMACKLTENAPAVSGVVQYAKEFALTI